MTRPIAIGISPNTESEDVIKAIKQILKPWLYKKGGAIKKVEDWFELNLKIKHSVSFSNARSALYAILQALEIGDGDEVIVQAFTCVVVPNSILATGARPVYADIKNFNLNPNELEKKITKKTKAVIVQHTFGIPAKMDEIVKIARRRKVYLIEDVAHTIGGEFNDRKLGTFGDAAIFSLGRDKAFSSVFGGIAVTSNTNLFKKIKDFQNTKPFPNNFWIAQQLFHPIAFSFILPLYNSGLGKIILIALQKLRLLSFPVIKSEKMGKFNSAEIKRFPNALAELALLQLNKAEKYNSKRLKIAQRYDELLQKLNIQTEVENKDILLRFPVLTDNPGNMRRYFRVMGKIYLGDWYSNVIDPKGSNYKAVMYQAGSCPKAESIAKRIVNLPLYPVMSDKDVEAICRLLEKYFSQ